MLCKLLNYMQDRKLFLTFSPFLEHNFIAIICYGGSCGFSMCCLAMEGTCFNKDTLQDV